MERGDYRIVHFDGLYFVVSYDELGLEQLHDAWANLDSAQATVDRLVAEDARLIASIVDVVEE